MTGNACDPEDSLCCNDNCDGPCKVCDFSGLGGTCVNLPPGMQVVGQCDEFDACNNNGECKPLNGASPLGEICSSVGLPPCYPGSSCKALSCRTDNDGLCTGHLDCTSNLCDPSTHTCKACAFDSDCPGGSACNTGNGQCKSWLGTPCSQDLDCVVGSCAGVSYLCGLPLRSVCTDHTQCASHNCKGGICVKCANNGDCAAGTRCITNLNPDDAYCLLKKGNLCAHNYNCNSNNCAGFPPRCQ